MDWKVYLYVGLSFNLTTLRDFIHVTCYFLLGDKRSFCLLNDFLCHSSADTIDVFNIKFWFSGNPLGTMDFWDKSSQRVDPGYNLSPFPEKYIQ